MGVTLPTQAAWTDSPFLPYLISVTCRRKEGNAANAISYFEALTCSAAFPVPSFFRPPRRANAMRAGVIFIPVAQTHPIEFREGGCLPPAWLPARHAGERWVLLLPFTGVGRQQRVRIATHSHMSDRRCHTLHELPTDLEIAATLASYIIRGRAPGLICDDATVAAGGTGCFGCWTTGLSNATDFDWGRAMCKVLQRRSTLESKTSKLYSSTLKTNCDEKKVNCMQL